MRGFSKNGEPEPGTAFAFADFTSALSARPEPVWTVLYIGVGAALVSAAVLRERIQATAAA
jgi:hypothetical protein